MIFGIQVLFRRVNKLLTVYQLCKVVFPYSTVVLSYFSIFKASKSVTDRHEVVSSSNVRPIEAVMC